MWAKVRDFLRFLRAFTFTKAGNLILVYTGKFISQIFHRPVVLGWPHTLSVEPTTRCNLSCPECPVGNKTLVRSSGDMSPALFQQILSGSTASLLHLILYFQGEPFLSPYIFEMIQQSKSAGIYVSTSTNGHFLSENNIAKILDSGLDRLVVSLDGASQESYKEYRVDGDFDRVVKGIEGLMIARRIRQQSHPYVLLQCLLFEHNLQERVRIKQLAKELGVDAVQFKTAQFYHLESENEMIPQQNEFSRYTRDEMGQYVLQGKLRNRCNRLWTTAVVTWDGVLVPCCFDKQASYPMGLLEEEDLKNSWKSDRFMKFRDRVLKRREAIDICQNCTEGIKKKAR